MSFFRDGIDVIAVHIALKAWGKRMHVDGEVAPLAFGWTGKSITDKFMKDIGVGTARGPSPPEAAIDKLSEKREEMMLLGSLVPGLPFIQRRAVELRYCHKLKREDIALQLGCSPDQVRRRLAEAKVALVTAANALRPDWRRGRPEKKSWA